MREVDFYKSLELAAFETFGKNGFDMGLANENYHLSKLFYNTVRKYCNALPSDIQIELATEAFISVFKKNYYNNFNFYSGSYNGREVTLEVYINMLFRNALITASKAYCTLSKRDTSGTYQSEGETIDAFDLIQNGETKVKTLSISNIEDREYFEECLQDLKDELKRTESGTKEYSEIEKDIKYYMDRLEQIEQHHTPNYYEQDDGVFTVDEELSFCDLKDSIITELEKTKVYDIKHSVLLELLCEGYTINEVAKYMKITNKQLESYINDVIVALIDLSEQDSRLRYALKKFTDNFTNFKYKHERDLVDFDSTRDRIVDVLECDVAEIMCW